MAVFSITLLTLMNWTRIVQFIGVRSQALGYTEYVFIEIKNIAFILSG
jgi:hypothetical protein